MLRLEVLLIIFGSIVVSLIYRTYRSRLRKGLYVREIENKDFVIRTDLCKIKFNGEEKCLSVIAEKQNLKIPFSELLGLRISYTDNNASLSEFFFEDFDITDLFERYRDLYLIDAIIMNTKNRTLIPIFVVLQYKVEDFLNFMVPIQLFILEKFGLYRDINEYAYELLNKMKEVFSQYGVPLEIFC